MTEVTEDFEVAPDDIVQDDEDAEPPLPDTDPVPPEAPTEELSALEASARAWESFKFLRDGTDNVVRMTDAEKYDLSRLLGEIR